MSLSRELNDIILKNYIQIDILGNIVFKSALRYKSKKSAILVVYELLYRSRNHEIKNEEDIYINELRAVNDFEFDENTDNYYIKKYSTERYIVSRFLDGLYKEKEIENMDIILANRYFLNNLTTKNNLEKFSNTNPNKSQQQRNKKNIKIMKKYLNSFNKEDLCYILDINPELNFEKEKILKNRLIEELNKYSIDIAYLKNHSKEELKNYFFLLKNKNEAKKELNRLKKIDKKNKENILNIIKKEIDRLYEIDKKQKDIIKETIENELNRLDEINVKQKDKLKETIENELNKLKNTNKKQKDIINKIELEKQKKIFEKYFLEIKRLNSLPIEEFPLYENEFKELYKRFKNIKFTIPKSYSDDIYLFKYHIKYFDDIKILINLKEKIDIYIDIFNRFDELLNQNAYMGV